MPSTTVRLSTQSHHTLKALAKTTGRSLQEVLEAALDAYRREAFVKASNASYERLRKKPKEWADYVQEREAWDATLTDGLDGKD